LVVVDLEEKVVHVKGLLMEEMDKILFSIVLQQLAEAVEEVTVILTVAPILVAGLVYLEVQVVVAALIVQQLLMLMELLVKEIEVEEVTDQVMVLVAVVVVLEV
tara:strand:+ start:81 stop:392 length:312 start_codon:yes stop_codon:yes gene_type:complete